MNTIFLENRNIENTIEQIRNLINDLANSRDIIKIVDIIGAYSDNEYFSNSKKEVANYYFKSVQSLHNKLGDFEEIFETIKKGAIS